MQLSILNSHLSTLAGSGMPSPSSHHRQFSWSNPLWRSPHPAPGTLYPRDWVCPVWSSLFRDKKNERTTKFVWGKKKNWIVWCILRLLFVKRTKQRLLCIRQSCGGLHKPVNQLYPKEWLKLQEKNAKRRRPVKALWKPPTLLCVMNIGTEVPSGRAGVWLSS